jgi:hypothetical protein
VHLLVSRFLSAIYRQNVISSGLRAFHIPIAKLSIDTVSFRLGQDICKISFVYTWSIYVVSPYMKKGIFAALYRICALSTGRNDNVSVHTFWPYHLVHVEQLETADWINFSLLLEESCLLSVGSSILKSLTSSWYCWLTIWIEWVRYGRSAVDVFRLFTSFCDTLVNQNLIC